MSLSPLCFFTCLALVVLVLPCLLLPFWYNLTKHMERELESDSRKIQLEILSEIDNSVKLLLPMNSLAANLVGTLNWSLSENDTTSFSKIQDKMAPQLLQSLLLVPYLSQVSYIGLDGLLLSFYAEGDQIVSAYSNGSFASNTSNYHTWYIQPVNRDSGRLYGEAVKSQLLLTPDNVSWVGKASNSSNGLTTLGSGWNQGRDLLLLNTAATGRGVVSMGFLVKRLTDLFTSIGLHGGSLYLATLEGTVLVEGLPNTRMVVANGSVSFELVNPGDEVVSNVVGNISCNQFRQSSIFNFHGVDYLLYCSPIQILQMQSVYALAFPYKGLGSRVRYKSGVLLILFIVMIIAMLFTIFSFVFLMIKAARREMRLCSSLIKQMEATQQAERKSMNKSVAFAKASHDVRASLAGIAGLIELSYQEVVRGSELETNLRQMDACSNDLLGLLNSILDTSKIEAGKMELEEEEFDLAQLVEDVVDLFHPVGMKKNVDVILDPHDGSLLKYPCVKGDRVKLKQILCNLISNAVKFTSKGNVSVRVWIEKPSIETSIIASNRNGFAKRLWCLFSKKSEAPSNMTSSQPNPNCMQFVFEVEDTGKGIPKEARNSVFETYVQVKDSALGQGGTGLGLGIVQSLVRLMNGDIQIVDKENEENGTCFRFNVLLVAVETISIQSGGDSESVGPKIQSNHSSSSPRMGMLSRSLRPEGSHVVLLIQNEERRRASQKFIESLGIKVTVIEQWDSLGPRLKWIKRRLTFSASKSDISPRSFNKSRNLGGKDMPLSSMDGTDQTPVWPMFKKTNSVSRGVLSNLVLIVIDVNAGPFAELCKVVAEFRRGFQRVFCRVVWLEKPGMHTIHLEDIEDGLVDPNDIIISKPFHGTRLYEVMKLLPEFGGGLVAQGRSDKSWRGSTSSENYSCHMRVQSEDLQSHARPTTPVSTPTISRDSLSQEFSFARSEIHEAGSSRPLSGKRILIAEDNAVLLKLAKKSVRQLGASVESCVNGREAVELVYDGLLEHGASRLLPYDYILMDCQMPEMDGKEATREIREVEKQYGVHIPIIAVTAHAQGSEETREAIEAGMDVYLCKPLKPQHLLEAIRYIASTANQDTSI